MAAKYDKGSLREKLMGLAEEAADQLTKEFFSVVNDKAPVENGHLHQTLGTALNKVGLPESAVEASTMLSKGSGDPTATQKAFGSLKKSKTQVKVVVGTKVGFVNRLNDGDTVQADVKGATGFKVDRKGASEGILYAPRSKTGPVGYLMWYEGGEKFFTRTTVWQPLGFFEEAAVALRNKAREMGMT